LCVILGQSTVIDTVPALYQQIVQWIQGHGGAEGFRGIKQVFIGGDQIADELLYRLSEVFGNARITVTYGPTEGTIFCTAIDYAAGELGVGAKGRIIGRPLAGSHIYVLDKCGALLPVGVEGEICIGGGGVARGYDKAEALSEQQFVNHVYGAGKLYRSGDMGRWTAEGLLEFRGRRDGQVKIRGHRIELGEIERALLQSGWVQEAVVVARPDAQGNKRLVGYVVGDVAVGGGSPEDKGWSWRQERLLGYLRAALPDYMVPWILVELAVLPLTGNGKIDRQSLPEPATGDRSGRDYVGARTQAEQDLSAIWGELLGIGRIGMNDNFFELGGDSIITIQVVSRARRMGYGDLRVADLFTYQTIEALSLAIEQRRMKTGGGLGTGGVQGPVAEEELLTGPSGLLPVQSAYLSGVVGAEGAGSHFNQSLCLKLDKKITARELERAIGQLREHHDALRFGYRKSGKEWIQAYMPYVADGSPALVVEDIAGEEQPQESSLLSEPSPGQGSSLATALLDRGQYYQESLNIEQGELMRVVLFRTGSREKQNRLLIVIHHLAVDGVSWRILLEDLEFLLTGNREPLREDKTRGAKGAGIADKGAGLKARGDGSFAGLGAKGASYRSWYAALEQYGKSGRLLGQLGYWEKTVNGLRPLPVDTSYKGSVLQKEMGHYRVRLSGVQTQRLLQEVPRAYHTEITDLLLAALGRTWQEWSGEDQVVIGLEGHGREDIGQGLDTSRTVGWFTSLYPVLLRMGEGQSDGLLIKEVKEQLRKVPDKGLGYGVLRYIRQAPGLQGALPWELVFNYLGQLDKVVKAGGWFSGAEEAVGSGVSGEQVCAELLTVTGQVQGGELVLHWGYSRRHYEEGTIGALAERYVAVLSGLIDHCAGQEPGSGCPTPSDYGLGDAITVEELDAFLEEAVPAKREERNGGQVKGGRRQELEGLYRLSGLQEGMLFHSLYDGQAGAYVEQFSCELRGLDKEAFRQSWAYLLRRH
ncbi:condensation domain-containing protein, partial [Flavitalea flava]